jgi:hypothetical protein
MRVHTASSDEMVPEKKPPGWKKIYRGFFPVDACRRYNRAIIEELSRVGIWKSQNDTAGRPAEIFS